MIQKLLSQTRTTEVSGISVTLLIIYKKGTLDNDTYLASIFSSLQTQSNQIRTAIKQSKTKSNLAKKDLARDNEVRALYYLLIGLNHHPDQVIRLSSEKIMKIFRKYGLKMIKTSYLIESALINSLLEDLAVPALQTDIMALSGCAETIANLQTRQNDFKNANLYWGEKKSKEGKLPSATHLKKIVLEIINNQIVVYLNAMQQADKTVYGELAQSIAQIINDNNEAVKKRSKKEAIEPELSIDE